MLKAAAAVQAAVVHAAHARGTHIFLSPAAAAEAAAEAAAAAVARGDVDDDEAQRPL